MKCTQRLYLTADRKKVVGEGDKKAATLYAVPGDEIPEAAAKLFGLDDGHLKGFDPAAAPKAKEPETPPPTAIIATQALHFSNADDASLVGADDPDAGELYANVGDEIPLTAHDGFGLVDGHLPDFDPAKAAAEKEEADDVSKEQPAAGDKELKPGGDKEQKAGANKESGAGQAGTSGDKA